MNIKEAYKIYKSNNKKEVILKRRKDNQIHRKDIIGKRYYNNENPNHIITVIKVIQNNNIIVNVGTEINDNCYLLPYDELLDKWTPIKPSYVLGLYHVKNDCLLNGHNVYMTISPYINSQEELDGIQSQNNSINYIYNIYNILNSYLYTANEESGDIPYPDNLKGLYDIKILLKTIPVNERTEVKKNLLNGHGIGLINTNDVLESQYPVFPMVRKNSDKLLNKIDASSKVFKDTITYSKNKKIIDSDFVYGYIDSIYEYLIYLFPLNKYGKVIMNAVNAIDKSLYIYSYNYSENMLNNSIDINKKIILFNDIKKKFNAFNGLTSSEIIQIILSDFKLNYILKPVDCMYEINFYKDKMFKSLINTELVKNIINNNKDSSEIELSIKLLEKYSELIKVMYGKSICLGDIYPNKSNNYTSLLLNDNDVHNIQILLNQLCDNPYILSFINNINRIDLTSIRIEKYKMQYDLTELYNQKLKNKFTILYGIINGFKQCYIIFYNEVKVSKSNIQNLINKNTVNTDELKKLLPESLWNKYGLK